LAPGFFTMIVAALDPRSGLRANKPGTISRILTAAAEWTLPRMVVVALAWAASRILSAAAQYNEGARVFPWWGSPTQKMGGLGLCSLFLSPDP